MLASPPGVGAARLQRDVDDAAVRKPYCAGQRPGDQGHLVGVLGGEWHWWNSGHALGQLHAIQPVLQIAVVATLREPGRKLSWATPGARSSTWFSGACSPSGHAGDDVGVKS
jgi:hypothetical protein